MSEDYFDEDGDVLRKAENRVIFKNMQWVVSGDGFLSAIWCSYHIDPASLQNGVNLDRSWHDHVARKTWIDMDAFNAAYRAAVKFNKLKISDEQIAEWEARAERYIADREPTPRYMKGTLEQYGYWQ